MGRRKLSALTASAMCAVLITACAWITVPTSPPFTMQSFAVMLLVLLFGTKISWMGYVTYLALGAAGVPVFSGFRGGIYVLTGQSGGFLWGFLLAIPLCGWIILRLGSSRLVRWCGMLSGLAVTYASGTVFYSAVWLGSLDLEALSAAALQCIAPFAIFDIVKLAAADILYERLKGKVVIP